MLRTFLGPFALTNVKNCARWSSSQKFQDTSSSTSLQQSNNRPKLYHILYDLFAIDKISNYVDNKARNKGTIRFSSFFVFQQILSYEILTNYVYNNKRKRISAIHQRLTPDNSFSGYLSRLLIYII